MAADDAQQEPTMEEILASIRKIISEDDEPANDEAASTEADFDTEDVLDLQPTEEFEAEEPEPEASFEEDFESDDIVAVDFEEELEPEPEPIVEPEPVIEPEPVQAVSMPVAEDTERLTEDEVAGSAAGAFGRLMGTMSMGDGATLESIVREMLRPMLKEWLNENLPGIVEAKVEEEVKRISRMAR